MNRNELEDLLNDVLLDPSERENSRCRARLEFRSRVRKQRFVQIVAIGAVLTVLAAVMMVPSHQSTPPASSSAGPIAQAQGMQKRPALLSDDELLRFFPPESCYLAEVGGKVVLVFRDPAVNRQFLN